MKDQDKTKAQLIAELEELRQQVAGCKSDNQRLESALRECERQHKTLLYNLPEKVFWKDAASAYVACNQNYASDFGMTPEQIVGKTDFDLYSSDMAEKYRADDRRIMDTGATEEIEEAYRTPVGKNYVVRTVKVALRDSSGNVAGILGIFSDITAQREAERALRERETRLAEAQEVASLGFYIFHITTGDFTTSSVLDRLFGIPAQYERTVPGWAMLIHPDDRQGMLDYLLTEVVENKRPFDREYRIVRHDDKQLRWVHGLGRLQFNEEGQPVLMLGTVQDVTERKQAEEQRQQFVSLAENSHEFIGMCDMQFQPFFANEAGMRMVGLDSLEQVVQTPVREFFFPEDQAFIIESFFPQVLRNGHGEVEIRFRHFKTGEPLWMMYAVFALTDATGKPSGLATVSRNIGERKQAEQELRKAHDELERRVEERTAELQKANEELTIFHRFAEASGQGFGMADMDGRATYSNPALCRIAGVAKAEDAIGTHLSRYYPEGYMRKREEEILPALLRGGHWEGELRTSIGGRTIYVLQNSFLIRDENGNPSRIASVITDITERKRAEEALRASDERYDLAVRGAGVGIWDWDLSSGNLYISPRWTMLFGYNAQELGRNLEEWARLLHPDDRERVRKTQEKFLASTATTITSEFRMRKKDGSYCWVVEHAIALRDGEGKAKRIVGSHTDITGRKHAEAALQREHRTLEHMLKASDHERQLIAYDIHDGLAQELAGAIMQFQIYDQLKAASPSDATKAYDGGVMLLQQSHKEARRLISGVRPPILDESGIIAAISHLVHDPAFDQGPKIDFRARVTFNRLNPVVENVIYRIVQEGLTNARNHSKSKKIVVSLIQRGERLRVEVRDWGVGFDPKTVQENRFGLEGIRERARLLGGKCSIKSTPGKGTLVTVELPVMEQRKEER